MLVGLAIAWCGQGRAQEANGSVDHIGTWKCVLYGHPAFGDEQQLLRFLPDGRTELARPSADRARPWAYLSTWNVDKRQVLTFSDPRTGRRFEADLTRATLGGTWKTLSLIGGWWCSRVGKVATDVQSTQLASPDDDALMPPLVPAIMATPVYPSAAIRRGLEGRAVACFFVDADGDVTDPEIIELSDELFRGPTLEALTRSKYRRWTAGTERRPACRSYLFRLEPVMAPSG